MLIVVAVVPGVLVILWGILYAVGSRGGKDWRTGTTTPSAPSSVASQHFLDVAATPPGQEGSFALELHCNYGVTRDAWWTTSTQPESSSKVKIFVA